MSLAAFQNILVAMDTSEVSQTAFEKALVLSKALNAKLLLAHILRATDCAINPALGEQTEQAWTEHIEHYETLLKQKVLEAKSAGVSADYIQTHGISGAALCYVALQKNVDLLVVGSHRRQGLSTLLTGSTSSYINRHAHCPVLMVYPTAGTNAEHQQREERFAANS